MKFLSYCIHLQLDESIGTDLVLHNTARVFFQSDHTVLHSFQQCITVLAALYPHQHLVLSSSVL